MSIVNAPLQRLAAKRHDRDRSQFRADVIAGLSQLPKSLPCKYFYDAVGSRLFDQICELPEYYPTRTELGIFQDRLNEIAADIPNGAALIEYGSGSSTKTRLLLDRLEDLSAYVPVEICRSHLLRTAWQLRARYPRIKVKPVCADFTRAFRLPRLGQRPRVIFFPGSTIGNFPPEEAVRLMRSMARQAGRDGGLLIGVDLLKGRDVLEAAYADCAGVTAEFNLNLLVRINRELGGTFDRSSFAHRANFNADLGRVEMHLLSLRDQSVEIAGERIFFAEGETIHTENSHKYSIEGFRSLAEQAGWSPSSVWTDRDNLFSVHYLRCH